MFQREEYAIVLDFLPHGKAGEAAREPVAQLIGENKFTLLEAIPKPDVKLEVGERVYIGRGVRDKIGRIRGRINFSDLTSAAQNEAKRAIKQLIKEREAFFVDFFNKAGPINIRAHTLEHIPSVGKKHLQAILDARKQKPFESFKDIQTRVPHLQKIDELLLERILHELTGHAKHYLFTKPPSRHYEE